VGKAERGRGDTRFRLSSGRYLCEVRGGQYWRLENLKSFDEFWRGGSRESRRKAYYLMVNPRAPAAAGGRELKEVDGRRGWSWPRVARRDGQHFIGATWLHKGREMPKEDFRREVEKELTGKEEEPSELIYFKIYKNQTGDRAGDRRPPG